MGGSRQRGQALTWHEFADGWHDFYLMAGTAAVTLAGLLFVAISLHVDVLVHETRQHLLGLARATLFSFVFVLVLSMVMLIPHSTMRPTGTALAAIGAAFLLVTLRQAIRTPVEHADFSGRLFRRRLLLPMLGYGATSVVGILLVRGSAEWIYLLIGVTTMLLGNAAGTSWDMLVRVARIRRKLADEVTSSASRVGETQAP